MQKFVAVFGDPSLTITSTFSEWQAYSLDDKLTVTSTFTYEHSHGLADRLKVKSIFQGYVLGQQTLTDLLELRSNFVGVNLNPNFVGSALPVINDIPGPLGLGKNLTPLTFQIFFPTNSHVITINAPIFGDTESYKQIRNQEYTRGGTLIIFREDIWGEEGVFEYTLTYLTTFEKETFLAVLRSSLGQHIKIIDHLGITRIGFILTPEADIIQPVRNGWSVTFKFQEELNI